MVRFTIQHHKHKLNYIRRTKCLHRKTIGNQFRNPFPSPNVAQVKTEAEVDPKEIAEATCTKYTKGSGEWAFSDKLPKLREALLKADKRLEFEGHTYRLQGAENKFVARYPKKKGG